MVLIPLPQAIQILRCANLWMYCVFWQGKDDEADGFLVPATKFLSAKQVRIKKTWTYTIVTGTGTGFPSKDRRS